MCFGENTVKDAVPGWNEGAVRQILPAVRSGGRAFRTAKVNTGGEFLLILSE